MVAAAFRRRALALPGAVEASHMGHPDFRVGGRIFATLTADEAGAAVKCDPVSLGALVRRDPAAFRDAWGGRWLGIDLQHADEEAVMELLQDAWRLVAPKRLLQ